MGVDASFSAVLYETVVGILGSRAASAMDCSRLLLRRGEIRISIFGSCLALHGHSAHTETAIKGQNQVVTNKAIQGGGQ